RDQPARQFSASGHLCGQDPQGRQARRPARGAANQVRAGHQPQDGQGARADHSAVAAPARRRGDPVTTRRGFLSTLAAGLLAAPLTVRAQEGGKVWKVGVLAAEPADSGRADGFREGLRAHGLVEGQNIAIDWRSAEGNPGRYPDLAAELVRLGVDVIVAGSVEAVAAAQKATRTIPIVIVYASDPVAFGF